MLILSYFLDYAQAAVLHEHHHGILLIGDVEFALETVPEHDAVAGVQSFGNLVLHEHSHQPWNSSDLHLAELHYVLLHHSRRLFVSDDCEWSDDSDLDLKNLIASDFLFEVALRVFEKYYPFQEL